ncbi:nucleotide pyrophosphohydrolase [Candidatus Azambacteria bacterium RIFCSPHIGHO2_01_FULL_40_24]|uniref:Nucleotide pyrophosphohydrolase n=1 Tax=Candidatus Azambacteria bacterium RIFCSPHIGHO2_01_FULL_40_24 TaxID=1797301 RepID=A0A1F5B274_9BACT|nr:MAG: nucleotide pyrophosphohydrolase [Candidatus Azambacteria bacterium RIFCSPHIGHO2_01_FULL_40_24]
MKKYQKELDKFFKENKWSYWPPLVILARLFEEGGELARVVNHLYGKKPKKKTESEQDLEEELGDIIFTCICFANSKGLDLDRAIKKTFKKAMTRDKNRF